MARNHRKGIAAPGPILGLAGLVVLVVGGALALYYLKGGRTITERDVEDGAKIAALRFGHGERRMMVPGLRGKAAGYRENRKVPLPNSVAPAISFDPVVTGLNLETEQRPCVFAEPPDLAVPANLEDLAFAPVSQLAKLIRTRQVTATDLTRMYLGRLKKYGPKLLCVVTLTEATALEQAGKADAEIASGKYRGPLHGIPWGAKDLLATKGVRTTWGSAAYRDQVPDANAAVVDRLEAAGAVLVAKLSMGELAMGDVWFGGKTRNPWNYEQGSSGSSAGSASAVAAGLVGFAIGTETWGSIVSPATRCGATGLRPTYGRVSRAGAMALSWTMDKIGPIARTAEDCALVFDAIRGPDGRDLTVVDLPFNYDGALDLGSIRVGYLVKAFEEKAVREEEKARKANDAAALDVFRGLGVSLVPLELPSVPVEPLAVILDAESAAAFDELTRSGRDDLLVEQDAGAWPNVFREARLIPAVEYIQANRVRTLLMEDMARRMKDIDVYIAPSFAEGNLLLTNLTGHPTVVLPNGFDGKGAPTSISLVGSLYGEAKLLRLANAFQDATAFHRKHPVLKE
jgi:Asp-tRNA(Asn)/Glu-tRNA(Gln) amidotransferase A subunit family amidase